MTNHSRLFALTAPFAFALLLLAGKQASIPGWADLPAAPANPTGVCNATGVYGVYADFRDVNQDGKPDTYTPDDGVSFDAGSGNFLLAPRAPRGLRILLPATALAQLGAPPFDPTTDWTWIHIPGLLQATQPGVLGQAAPPGSGSSKSVFLYFRVDSSGDGRLSQVDEQYNLRWQAGINLVSVTTGGGKVKYDLATDCYQSSQAELILRTNRGEISKGFYSVPLTLHVER